MIYQAFSTVTIKSSHRSRTAFHSQLTQDLFDSRLVYAKSFGIHPIKTIALDKVYGLNKNLWSEFIIFLALSSNLKQAKEKSIRCCYDDLIYTTPNIGQQRLEETNRIVKVLN